ncbi:hypothetical protein XENTR_v10003240 [Xenopus tropicalis]|nr:hypothetical protein XENTR_v10003240 [Xenopus tropicalis]
MAEYDFDYNYRYIHSLEVYEFVTDATTRDPGNDGSGGSTVCPSDETKYSVLIALRCVSLLALLLVLVGVICYLRRDKHKGQEPQDGAAGLTGPSTEQESNLYEVVVVPGQTHQGLPAELHSGSGKHGFIVTSSV